MDDLQSLSSLVVAVGYMLGTFCALIGLWGFKKRPENPQQYTIGYCVGNFFTGCALLASSFIYSAMSGTLGIAWDGSRNGLSLSSHDAESAAANMPNNFLTKSLTDDTKKLIIGFVFLVGAVAFIRGIYLCKDFGERRNNGGSGTAMALFHMIGGIICMNILLFSCIFAKTFNIPHICST